MKKLMVVAFILSVFVFGQSCAKEHGRVKDSDEKEQAQVGVADALGSYLQKYFGSSKYEVLKEKLDLGKIQLIVAVRYVDAKEKILDKGIGVEVRDSRVVPHVYFEKDKILDGKRKDIIDVSIHHYKYYGWIVRYSIPKNPGYTNGFSMDYISFLQGHLVMADPLSIHWDFKKGKFEKTIFPIDE